MITLPSVHHKLKDLLNTFLKDPWKTCVTKSFILQYSKDCWLCTYVYCWDNGKARNWGLGVVGFFLNSEVSVNNLIFSFVCFKAVWLQWGNYCSDLNVRSWKIIRYYFITKSEVSWWWELPWLDFHCGLVYRSIIFMFYRLKLSVCKWLL